jgi:hypothetical protein
MENASVRAKTNGGDRSSQEHARPKVGVDHLQGDIVAILVAMTKVVGSMRVGDGEVADSNGVFKGCQNRLTSCMNAIEMKNWMNEARNERVPKMPSHERGLGREREKEDE